MSKQPKMNLKALLAQPAAAVIEEAPEPQTQPSATVVPMAPAGTPLGKPAKAKEAEPAARTGEGASRRGTIRERATQMSVYLEHPAYDQLRELAFTERKKMHQLLLEGVDLLFKKRGLKSLAQLEKAGPQ